jgi:elongator complex protein 2
MLKGHSDTVNAVHFLRQAPGALPILLSGSADTTVRIWQASTSTPNAFKHVATLEGHKGSVNCIASVEHSNIVVTGAVDGCLRMWRITYHIVEEQLQTNLLQIVALEPRYFPLCLALHRSEPHGHLILAVGGTKGIIQIYSATFSTVIAEFIHRATMTGHEGWLRSLDFVVHEKASRCDVMLASASQDKYIRLWQLHKATQPSLENSVDHLDADVNSAALSNKAHKFRLDTLEYSFTFEALLLGHEDWIYTSKWRRSGDRLQLLSASADNSLAIWEADPASGVWICTNRMGEISAQKGSTTATGSSGGFWIGLWSPDGTSVVSLGRTGSWRRWVQDNTTKMWSEQLGLSGHIKEVRGLSWSKDGQFLLSASADQTTRLHGLWERQMQRSWHELSRPQIHGYDINCIATITDSQFVSGAEEKLLRVFDKPRQVAQLVSDLSGDILTSRDKLPETASMPVLGLSNKAGEIMDKVEMAEPRVADLPDTDPVFTDELHLTCRPPTEDILSRHSLWPEHEKLYGHGYEISALSCSHDGTIVATACKATSLDHAVIRLYDSHHWREIKPPLRAHALTVTSLDFSDDDKFLLSAGRDRQWSVFEKDPSILGQYQLSASNPKGHTRMILGAAWAPSQFERVFATAARDKSVKLWTQSGDNFIDRTILPAVAAVTDIAFLQHLRGDDYILAAGLENGGISIHRVNRFNLQATQCFDLPDP